MEKVSRRESGQAGETMRWRKGEREKITDSPIHRFPDSKKRGFSLMELMVVVVIIGIMVTAAAVWFANSRERINLRNSTRDVASLLRLAYGKAIADRVNYRVALDLSNEKFWLERGNMAGVEETDAGLVYTKTGEPGTERKVHKYVNLYSVKTGVIDGSGTEYATSGTCYALFRPRGTSGSWDGSDSDLVKQSYTITLKNTKGTILTRIRVRRYDSSIEVDYTP